MRDPWLTIVTPVRDDYQGLSRSLESIREQDREGVEVLVIDSSIDHEPVRAACEGLARVEAMEPEGVYPAMNVGLQRAGSTYLHFLTAGDVFHDNRVLARIREVCSAEPVWMFGPVDIIDETGKHTTTPPWNYGREKARMFARGHFPQHQGTVVRRDVLLQVGGFPSNYRIAADYATFLRLSQLADPVLLDFVVADFHTGGLSSVAWRESFDEFHRARLEVLQPRGTARIVEMWDYATHLAKVGLYREMLEPLRRRARR